MHPRVKPVLEKRREMAREGKVDWAFGELLAFGSLVDEGALCACPARTPGAARSRSATRCSSTARPATSTPRSPRSLANADNGGKFMVYDSALSEYAVVGFEYGYSVGNPDALVLWEAQFGDFVNGAQSIIDEFISSGEAKWGQLSDVVLLLPHGHEGQGPDHTSGRIERFLQLCAEGSMTVAVPSTPASYFHLLRRHAPRRHPPPAGGLHAEVDAAQQGCGQQRRGLHRRQVPLGLRRADIRDRRRRSQQGQAGAAGQRQAVLRAARAASTRTTATTSRSSASSSSTRCRSGGSRRRSTGTRTPTEFRWVQEEPANQGAWPFFGLALPELLPE